MAIEMENVVTGVVFTVVGVVVGLVSLLISTFLVPKVVNLLTPHIDEEKEILKGNVAVARYFGGIVQATIIGMSIIIGASIVAGILG